MIGVEDVGAAVLLAPVLAGLTGYLLYVLRAVPSHVLALLRRRFVVEVDVLGSDPLFGWVSMWLDEQPYTRAARQLTAAAAATNQHLGGRDATPAPPIRFTPAPGHHLIRFRGRRVWLQRQRKEVSIAGEARGGFQETYTFRAPGRSTSLLRALFEEARDTATAGGRTVGVYVGYYGEWYRVHELRPRALASVVLPAGVAETVIEAAERFLGGREWYEERGIPWRLGMLFEGPPGTGKSSLISALAGHLGLDLYIVNLGGKSLNDQALTMLLLRVPERSAILLEDVDAAVQGREIQGDSGVTFSGLLNALDGVASKPGVITFQTTNHAERLDPAQVRRGRVDVRIRFGPATRDQAARLFRGFYAQPCEIVEGEFAAAGGGRSMADLQGVLQEHRDDPRGAVRALTEISA